MNDEKIRLSYLSLRDVQIGCSGCQPSSCVRHSERERERKANWFRKCNNEADQDITKSCWIGWVSLS